MLGDDLCYGGARRRVRGDFGNHIRRAAIRLQVGHCGFRGLVASLVDRCGGGHRTTITTGHKGYIAQFVCGGAVEAAIGQTEVAGVRLSEVLARFEHTPGRGCTRSSAASWASKIQCQAFACVAFGFNEPRSEKCRRRNGVKLQAQVAVEKITPGATLPTKTNVFGAAPAVDPPACTVQQLSVQKRFRRGRHSAAGHLNRVHPVDTSNPASPTSPTHIRHLAPPQAGRDSGPFDVLTVTRVRRPLTRM